MSSISTLSEKRLDTTWSNLGDAASAVDNQIETGFSALSSLSDLVKKETNRWAQKLPYHINLLDILDPEETDHSRIIFQILRYRAPVPDGRHELFESLIRFIADRHKGFRNITIENPWMTAENMRIDLCVQEEGKYVIIFENKSNSAVDQPNQLARYIKCMKRKYKEEQIYLLYLPPFLSKKPEAQTWVDTENPDVELEKVFRDRYVNCSFRDYIIPWLTEIVMPNIRHKDDQLLCAISQYVDHWKGRLGLRTIEKEKVMSIDSIIRKNIGIASQRDVVNSQTFKDLDKLRERAKEFSNVLDAVNRLEREIANGAIDHRKKITLFFLKKLKDSLSSYYEICWRDNKLENLVNTHFDKHACCGIFSIDVKDVPFKFEFHLGNDWISRGSVANYYYGFINSMMAKPGVLHEAFAKKFPYYGTTSDHWCHYRTSDDFAENFTKIRGDGVEFWADEKRYGDFIKGLAGEIHNYIEAFRQFYLESANTTTSIVP